jgi:2-polyprenyl-6-methoxyphenol hydroxylase-like FAD-dependent oxidoreductase
VTPSDEMYDVAIVGCGPVGSALAILLGQRGRRVIVLERWLEPYPLPRAVHFDHEIGRILQSCGLGAELAAISEPAEIYEWRNATGDTLLRFGRVGTSASGWPESSMFNQPALEALLAARVEALPTVDLCRGVGVVGLRQMEEEGSTVGSVSLTCRGAEGDAPLADITLAARYVVGCDGANSTVRSLVDVPVHDLGFFYDWLIVDLVLDEPRVFDPINLQICDPVRPTTAVSGGPGRRRWEFMRLPHEPLDELNDEATAWRLLEAWDITPTNATMERHTVYTFQARWAARWRTGRVFLAGDAAHLMPPFAGQGMCSGLRDAANLAWKLDLVIRGGADDVVLDTYERERMPNAEAVIEFSMALGKVICVPDADEAAARDEAMRAGVVEGQVSEVPPLPAIDSGLITATPAAGSLFLQGMVEVRGVGGEPTAPEGGRDRFDEMIGAGWHLLIADSGSARDLAIDRPLEMWFHGIGGQVHTISDAVGSDLGDVDGDYGRWFARHDVHAVIQRPDFYVYGTAPDATGGVAAAVDDLLRHLRDDLSNRPFNRP